VLLSNISTASGKLDEIKNVREWMKETQAWKRHLDAVGLRSINMYMLSS
jgi:hypothetical protein